MVNCIFVGLGGFIGAVCRYLIGLVPMKAQPVFPVKTFLINIIGAFAIGLIAALAAKNSSVDPHLILFLKMGICGGFTTFSTFSLEALTLLERNQKGIAVVYIFLSVVGCVIGVWFGKKLIMR